MKINRDQDNQIQISGTLVLSVCFLCISGLIGQLFSFEILYNWGSAWDFSTLTACIYLALVALFFHESEYQVSLGILLSTCILSSFAWAGPDHSYATHSLQLLLSFCILFSKIKLIQESLLIIATNMVIMSFGVFFSLELPDLISAFYSNTSLPSIITAICLISIIILEKDPSGYTNLKITKNEIIASLLFILTWGFFSILKHIQSDTLSLIALSFIISLSLYFSLSYVRKARELRIQNTRILEGLNHAAIIVITDKNGVIHYVNERFCQLSGYSKEELIGNTHRIIHSEVHDRDFWNNLWETIGKGEIWNGTICNRNKSGKIYWEETTIIPVQGSSGQLMYYLGLRFDITDRIRTEEELNNYKIELEDRLKKQKGLIQFKDRINRVLSHDLRTPIAQIISYCDLIRIDAEDKKSKKNSMETIEKIAKQALSEIESLLNLQQKNYLLHDNKSAPIKINDIVTNEINAHHFDILDKSIEIIKELPTLPNTVLPESLFRHIFRNLLSNAIKYTPTNGKIKISVLKSNTELILVVEDSGPGIPEDEKDKIFDPFYSSQKNTSKLTKSWGIGLSFVYETILTYGGHIHVEDASIGGAKFIVHFPLK